MFDKKTRSSRLTPQERHRPPLSMAVAGDRRRRRSQLPRPSLLLFLLFGVVGVLYATETQAAEPRPAAVPPLQTSPLVAAPHDVARRLDLFPDGRPLSSSLRRRPRRGSRRKDQREGEREDRRRRTEDEIDRLHSEYWKEACSKKSWPLGTAYARFSTRFQESIADQIRKILEFALANQIRVPRHLIFYDLGVRGAKNRRAGLDDVRATLRSRKATVLLLFATNRLFRKTYRTLEFVDMVHKQWQARCIFVMTGIDTENKDEWESRLHLHALMDQFVVRSGVAHIHAAHEGLLEKGIVFGTLSYGYSGQPIEGQYTKQKRPRREIAVDESTAAVVRKIFHWYVEDRLDVVEIVRRLNADPSLPLPERAANDRWTRSIVRHILQNTRYRGLWQYGVYESVFLPEADYVRQRLRVEPLKEVQIEVLRIVADALWYGAQERLATERGTRRGRPPVDGDTESRPKLLNGLLVCPTHDDQALHVGGPHGRAMVCPVCRTMSAAERPLYTILNRRLAAELLIAKVVGLLAGDAALIEQVIAVCRAAADAAQRPDPQAVTRARHELGQLERAVALTRRTVGESDEEQAEAERTIRQLQGEAAGLRAELARLESVGQQIPRIPTADEITTLLAEAAERLTAATASNDPEVIAQARCIVELVTDGRIALEQQGQRKPQRGWLRGRFHVRLLRYLVDKCGDHAVDDDGIAVTIDFRRTSRLDSQAETAWQLREQGLLHSDIGEQLGCGKSMVTKLLQRAALIRGEPYQDGRRRRGELRRKNRVPPKYERMAAQVGAMVDDGRLLSEIAEFLKLDRNTVTKAYNMYRSQQGLPPLDGRARRKLLNRKNRPASEADHQ